MRQRVDALTRRLFDASMRQRFDASTRRRVGASTIRRLIQDRAGEMGICIAVPKVFYKWQLGVNKGRSNYDARIGIQCLLDLELFRRGSTPPTLEESMGEEGF